MICTVSRGLYKRVSVMHRFWEGAVGEHSVSVDSVGIYSAAPKWPRLGTRATGVDI